MKEKTVGVLILGVALLAVSGCLGDTADEEFVTASSQEPNDDAILVELTLEEEPPIPASLGEETLVRGDILFSEPVTTDLRLGIEEAGWETHIEPEQVETEEADSVSFQALIQPPPNAERNITNLTLKAENPEGDLRFELPVPVNVTSMYKLPVNYDWETTDLDILLIPPAHGPIYSEEEGALPHGPEGAMPNGAYLQATLHVLADWEHALETVASQDENLAWVSQISWDLHIVGLDVVRPQDIAAADIVKYYPDAQEGGAASRYHWDNLGLSEADLPDCFARSGPWMTGSGAEGSVTYEDMYSLAGHELIHCFGAGHVVDHTPERDIMAYEDWPKPALRCPSNLDVRAVAGAFSSAVDAEVGIGDEATIAPQDYQQYCDPENDPR